MAKKLTVSALKEFDIANLSKATVLALIEQAQAPAYTPAKTQAAILSAMKDAVGSICASRLTAVVSYLVAGINADTSADEHVRTQIDALITAGKLDWNRDGAGKIIARGRTAGIVRVA